MTMTADVTRFVALSISFRRSMPSCFPARISLMLLA